MLMPRWRKIRLTALILTPLLTSCAAASSEAPPATVVVRSCPTVRTYTTAQANAAAKELDSLGYPSMLSQFMADYSDLRAAVIDCKKG